MQDVLPEVVRRMSAKRMFPFHHLTIVGNLDSCESEFEHLLVLPVTHVAFYSDVLGRYNIILSRLHSRQPRFLDSWVALKLVLISSFLKP